MSAVLISAVQSVKIFGFWRQPVLTLSWTDIVGDCGQTEARRG